MPRLVFSLSELLDAHLAVMRATSREILELTDLERNPLNPGESPDARRHKIARAGKRLAERVLAMDELVESSVAVAASADDKPAAPDGAPETN